LDDLGERALDNGPMMPQDIGDLMRRRLSQSQRRLPRFLRRV